MCIFKIGIAYKKNIFLYGKYSTSSIESHVTLQDVYVITIWCRIEKIIIFI